MTPRPRPPGLPEPILPPEHVAWCVETFPCPIGHAPRGEPCRPAEPDDPWAEVCIPRILEALKRDIARVRRSRERQAEHLSQTVRRKARR